MKLQIIEVSVQEQNNLFHFECPICSNELKGHHTQNNKGVYQGYQTCNHCEVEFVWFYADEFVCYSREAK